jgi:hypothetical protein
VDVVSNAAHSQYRNFIFARDAAEICMKPLPHFVPDGGSSFGGRKHHVNQTAYVTMRHAFSRPFGTIRSCQCVPRTTSWAIFSPSLRDYSHRSESTQDLAVLNYFRRPRPTTTSLTIFRPSSLGLLPSLRVYPRPNRPELPSAQDYFLDPFPAFPSRTGLSPRWSCHNRC